MVNTSKLNMGSLILYSEKAQTELIKTTNDKSANYGLILSDDDIQYLMAERRDNLKRYERLELGDGITQKLILKFCDSPYISQTNYVDTIAALMELYYYYTDESYDTLKDDYILELMKKHFEGSCRGSIELLEERLEELTLSVRTYCYEKIGGGLYD